MQGKTLAQYCPNDSALSAEQNKIEQELIAFEKNIYGNPARRDSLDSTSVAKEADKSVKKSGRSRRGSVTKSSVSRTPRSSSNRSVGTSSARISVRRERH